MPGAELFRQKGAEVDGKRQQTGNPERLVTRMSTPPNIVEAAADGVGKSPFIDMTGSGRDLPLVMSPLCLTVDGSHQSRLRYDPAR